MPVYMHNYISEQGIFGEITSIYVLRNNYFIKQRSVFNDYRENVE